VWHRGPTRTAKKAGNRGQTRPPSERTPIPRAGEHIADDVLHAAADDPDADAVLDVEHGAGIGISDW
jgi:hypothetical protein